MAEWEELCRFLVGLASEITNNVTRGLQNVGQSFSNQFAGLSTVMSAQEVSQVVGSFDGEHTQYRYWIKSNEKYVLLSNQSKRLVYQRSRAAVHDYIQRYMADYPENSWEQLKSELNVRSAEVNDPHHAFTILHKARQVKNESVQVYVERLHVLANDAFAKVDKAVVE